MTVRNLMILAMVGEELAGLTHPATIGGDWNMNADIVEDSTFLLRAHVEMISPSAVTCRTPTASNTIDYFALSEAAMLLFRAVKVDSSWHTRPHRPVQLHRVAV
eukprot:9399692-Pyramimonas_sp.AAC.1